MLFGYVFRERTGIRLRIEQISKDKRELWKTDIPNESSQLKCNIIPGDTKSRDLCVIINLMSKDDSSICSCAKKYELSFRAIVELTPPTYPFPISNAQALGIAQQITHEIKQAHAKYGTNTVHIFNAIPLGLALMIGYHLNACGKIQCYEFNNSTREYTPSCVLDSSF